MTDRLVGLPPLVDARTRVLVLGSFPGAASLAAQAYYGHPRNHFWSIMGHVFEAFSASKPMPDCTGSYVFSYAQRCQWLLDHGVGLWDVYASCEREGSLDVDIRHPAVNDFSGLAVTCPQLRLVAHNGGESYRHHRSVVQALAQDVPVVKLPSSSPANASWSLARKAAAWTAALCPVLVA